MDFGITTLIASGAMIGGATATLGKVFFVQKKTCEKTSGDILDKLEEIEKKREAGQAKHANQMEEIKFFMGEVSQFMKNGNKK